MHWKTFSEQFIKSTEECLLLSSSPQMMCWLHIIYASPHSSQTWSQERVKSAKTHYSSKYEKLKTFRGDYKCHFPPWTSFTLSPVRCTHSHNHPLWLHNCRTISIWSIFLEGNVERFSCFQYVGKGMKLISRKMLLLSHIFSFTWNTTVTSCMYRSGVELWFIALSSVFLLQTIFFLFCSTLSFNYWVFSYSVCMNLKKLWNSVTLFVAEACCQ